jgi:hypothetical protein
MIPILMRLLGVRDGGEVTLACAMMFIFSIALLAGAESVVQYGRFLALHWNSL